METFTLIQELGPAAAAAVVCVGLYLMTYLALRGLRDQAEANAQALTKLSEAAVKVEQAHLLMAASLTTVHNSLNQVVGDLIDVIKEVEK